LPGILFLLVLTNSFAQTDSSYLETEEILEDILQEPIGETDDSDIYDQLEQMLLNPIDLNTATVDELTRIPEVDITTAKLIVDHRSKYGKFFSVNELNSVQNLDRNLIKKITPFFYIEKAELVSEQEPYEIGKVFSQSKLFLRSRFINRLQTEDGFNRNKFEGTKPRIYNRLIVKYGNNIQAGMLAEKDPGESNINEFSTYHIALNDFGFLYKAVLIDYLLEFGQGLTFWRPYAFSKGADAVYPIKRTDRIIVPFTSSTENNFFRGGAASVKLDNFIFSGFYSDNFFDANIDSVTGEITSTPEDGLHRTDSENSRRKSANEKMFGGRVDYSPGNILNIGMVYYHSKISNPFLPSNVYDISGNEFNFTAAAYSISFNRFNLAGEFSYNGISVASVNILQIMINNDFTFITSIRNYPRNFYSLHGYGFGERSGSTSNEVGIYTGFKWRTPIGLINFYYDQFKFPYATFFDPNPSDGNEYLVDFLTKPIQKFELRLRFKYENKDVTETPDNTKQIVKRLRQAIRTEIIYSISNKIRLKGRFEYNSYRIDLTGSDEKGYLIFQDIRYTPSNNFNLYGRIIFFRTDSFNSAIYEYENNLTGVLTNIAMFDEGIRWYLMMRYRPIKIFTLSIKYAETYKPSEKSLGSGDSEIRGNIDNSLSLQLDLNL